MQSLCYLCYSLFNFFPGIWGFALPGRLVWAEAWKVSALLSSRVCPKCWAHPAPCRMPHPWAPSPSSGLLWGQSLSPVLPADLGPMALLPTCFSPARREVTALNGHLNGHVAAWWQEQCLQPSAPTYTFRKHSCALGKKLWCAQNCCSVEFPNTLRAQEEKIPKEGH